MVTTTETTDIVTKPKLDEVVQPSFKRWLKHLLHMPASKRFFNQQDQHAIAQAVLSEVGEALLSCTLMLPDDEEPLTDAYDIRDRLEHHVDAVIDGGWCGTEATTVIDMTDGIELLRQGKGDVALFGL